MTQDLKDRMAKYIHKAISNSVTRGGAIDPIDLTERIVDSVELVHDMYFEESGIAAIPEALRQQSGEPAWDHRSNAPAAEVEDWRPHFLTPPPPPSKAMTPVGQAGKSLIVMPSDPEFNQTKPADVPVRPGVFKASMKKAPKRPGSNAPQKQYWDEAELIDKILETTPEEIPFDIERADGSPFRIVAKRNVINKQGLGGVSLTYKDPRVGEGGEISLVAQHPFSLYDETIDVEEGLKSIVAQLVGIYRDRSGGMQDPVAVGAEPDMNMIRAKIAAGAAAGGKIDAKLGVGEAAAIDLQPGQRAFATTHLDHADRSRDEILQRVLASSRQSNSALVPRESQLKVR